MLQTLTLAFIWLRAREITITNQNKSYYKGRKEKNQKQSRLDKKQEQTIFAMHSDFRYHNENSVIAKIENFSMHSNFHYDSENSSVAKFWHSSSLFHCFLRLLFPLHYSISSSFDILHSRLAEIDKNTYEIDGNQPDFVMIGLTRRFGFQFLQKLQKQPRNAISRIIGTLMCKLG